MKVIVTTAGRTNQEMVKKARSVAGELCVPYVTRNKESIFTLQQREEADVIAVGKNRLELHPYDGEEPIFFHPNSSMFRAKRVLRGEYDPFLEATKLEEGMSFLDCTLGLASDSIIASLVTGESGRVMGIEGNRYVAYLVKEGLRSWSTGVSELDEAMQRIFVHHQTFEAYLRCCEDNSVDVVYFDPMFSETIEESDGIRGLKQVALYTTLSEEVMEEAKRVAKKRVVLKDHWQSKRFEQFGFDVYRRKTAKFHFGVLEV